jgi:hypothetical protein
MTNYLIAATTATTRIYLPRSENPTPQQIAEREYARIAKECEIALDEWHTDNNSCLNCVYYHNEYRDTKKGSCHHPLAIEVYYYDRKLRVKPHQKCLKKSPEVCKNFSQFKLRRFWHTHAFSIVLNSIWAILLGLTASTIMWTHPQSMARLVLGWLFLFLGLALFSPLQKYLNRLQHRACTRQDDVW